MCVCVCVCVCVCLTLLWQVKKIEEEEAPLTAEEIRLEIERHEASHRAWLKQLEVRLRCC